MAAVSTTWRDTCVNKWRLQLHESDETMEDEWKKYYEERNSLEEKHKLFDSWRPKSKRNRKSKDANSDEAEVDFSSHPILQDHQFTDGCFIGYGEDLENVVYHLGIMRESLNKFGLAELGSHLYTLKLFTLEDDSSNPRDVDMRSRLYSPFSSRSLDFKFTYHYRTRLYGVEDYHFLNVGLRTAEDIQPDPKNVFASLPKDSEKWLTFLEAFYQDGQGRSRGTHHQRIVPPVKLRKIQHHIFGKMPVADEEKAFTLSQFDMCKIVLAASGIELLKVLRTYCSGPCDTGEPDNIGWIWKCVKQNFEGGEDESDDNEDEGYMISASKLGEEDSDEEDLYMNFLFW